MHVQFKGVKGLMARWLALILGVSLQGCTTINNYWLGKDNAPVPEPLPPIVSKVAWSPCWSVSFPKGRGKESYFHLRPAIDGQIIYAATPEGNLKAIQKLSGQVLWEKQFAERLQSGPVVSSGRIVVTTNKANIMVLNQKDGRLLWQTRVSGDVLSLPIIIENRLIVKTIDGRLYAFDMSTGAKIWVTDHGTSSLIIKASSSPARYKHLVLAGFSDGKLDAVEVTTGRIVWQRNIAYANGSSDVDKLADISATPLVRGDIVYLTSYQGYMVAMSLQQGDFLWSRAIPSYHDFAINSETLYVSDSKDVIWAVGRQDGRVLWKQPALTARNVTAPVLMNQKVIIGDRQGDLYLLDAKHGDFIGHHALGSAVDVSPVVDGNHVYVMTARRQLHCFTIKG